MLLASNLEAWEAPVIDQVALPTSRWELDHGLMEVDLSRTHRPANGDRN